MSIQTVSSSPSHYYYQCQNCRDSFICPDWQPRADGEKASRVAACPYCKSSHLDTLNTLLPLVMN
ncbi:MAG: hypothetical protein HND53_12085 [Proteobacteria bacterium]|nr:hypothetical protein [Pseudomonadota bacterium]